MFNRNEDIKKAKGFIPNWVIAEKLGVSENTIYRWMRQELSDDKKQRILNAIKDIKQEFAKS
jgi:uncharacterized protein YjcR